MDSNADCNDPKPTEVNGDFFPSYEWILDCPTGARSVESRPKWQAHYRQFYLWLQNRPIILNYIVVFETKECW